MKTHLFTLSLVTILSFLLFGCASVPHSTTEIIDARHVEFALHKGSSIPVIFENGLGGRMEWWKEVLPGLPDTVTTFVYNRPGYGKSSPVESPRDGMHIINELRLLLQEKGLKPPYILVGHSLGGLYMQLFSRLHPDEIHALILVDSTHPRQLDGAGAIAKQSFFVQGMVEILVTGVAEDELELIPATGDEILRLTPFSSGPVYVLSASRPLSENSDLARDANDKRRDIARLHPGAKQVWVDSGHAIPLDKPESVVAAIQEALAHPQ